MKQTLKVLFIGNSHTYFNDMPYFLKYFSRDPVSIYLVDSVMLAHPGQPLSFHAQEPEVRFNILYGDYDYVVLQQAAHPFPGEDILLRDGKTICEMIKQTRAIPIAYMTWAEKAHPENQKKMTRAYQALARETESVLCPVGMAWEKVLQRYPQIELFAEDGEHASPVGSYLIACMFYGLIQKKTPEGLPFRIMKDNRILYDIPQETVELLQKTAWETLAFNTSGCQ